MVRCLWCLSLLVGLFAMAAAQEVKEQKPKTFRPVPHSTATVIKVDTDKNTITVKAIYRGQEVERPMLVQADSKLMKDGKDAKIGDFKEGEQVIVTWRSLKKGEYAVRFLADPPTFFAFLRYPTIKGKVKSFDAATLTIAIEAEGKE
ncbi:MAG: hypothetical protein NZ937_07645, partial [Armatimonadetes bacterium]|nr:hypothetical protein [Armatimonadota bacterium]